MATIHSSPIQIPLPIDDATVAIPLTRGYSAIVDAVDADLIAYKWSAYPRKNGLVYASRYFRIEPGNKGRKRRELHQIILERMLGRQLAHGEECDHIDLDALNNRRKNLRLATRQQNAANRGRFVNCTSGFKGVYFDKKLYRWRAMIKVDGIKRHIGHFDTPEEAHAAYCKAAEKYFGEFARFE